MHPLGFAVSVAVIAVSTWSVVHSLNEPWRGSRIAQAATDPQAGRPSAPEAVGAPVVEPEEPPAAAKRTVSSPPKISSPKPVLRPRAGTPAGGVRLRSRSSVVIVASNQFQAQEIGRRSRRLGELIQGGSLFSISNGTAVAVEEQMDGVAKVRILQGAMAGKQGWVPNAEISAK
ncbi:MAG TPA: hypothetical protein VKT49_00665 [Bryobacteraceae bacterium]|nr:hypothetical protein [Bryobacteraceae bacterium]